MISYTSASEANITAIPTSDMKAFLRVEHSADDTLIAALITSALQRAEVITGLSIKEKTFTARLDRFPCDRTIELLRYPVTAINSIKYTDFAGVEQTLPETYYTKDVNSEPGRVVLNQGYAWPSVPCIPGVVRIEFKAGWATASAIPEQLKTALKQIVAYWYENRGEADEANEGMGIDVANMILRSYRLPVAF